MLILVISVFLVSSNLAALFFACPVLGAPGCNYGMIYLYIMLGVIGTIVSLYIIKFRPKPNIKKRSK